LDLSWLIGWFDNHEGFATALVGFIAVAIAIFGWFATYIFQVRSQNQQTMNQLTNSARVEIVQGIRAYQDWLSKYKSHIEFLEIKLRNYQIGGEFNWQEEALRYAEILNTAPLQWNVAIEEHEILFREVADVRGRLQWRGIKIRNFGLWFQSNFFSYDDITHIVSNNRNEVVHRKMIILNESKKSLDYILNQSCLVEDIRIYIHNKCLSKLTGNKVPERKPPEVTVPRVIKDIDGKLKIINEDDSIQILTTIINDFAPKHEMPLESLNKNVPS
jgi:hypothetical protein